LRVLPKEGERESQSDAEQKAVSNLFCVSSLKKGRSWVDEYLEESQKALSRVTNRAIWTALRTIASTSASKINLRPHIREG